MCTFSQIFPLPLKFPSNMSRSQTSIGNPFLSHSPADCFFLSPVNSVDKVLLPCYGNLPYYPIVSPVGFFTFPSFPPSLTLTHSPHTHQLALSLSAQMIPTSLPHVSCPVIGPQHSSSRPFQPIQTALSQAGRRRCLQIPMRDSFSHLHVTSCDAFRRGL